MDIQRFEQEILKLAFETDARITAASVAYYLGIPSREANRMLNELLQDGVLELDSDEDGNLYYMVPHQGDIGESIGATRQQQEKARELEQLYQAETSRRPDDAAVAEAHAGQEAAADEEAGVVSEAARHALDGIGLVSAADEDEETEPFSPVRNRPREVSAQRATDGGTQTRDEAKQRPALPAPSPESSTSRSRPPSYTAATTAPDRGPDADGSAGHAIARRDEPSYSEVLGAVRQVEREDRVAARDVFNGVTSRSMEPDAWVDNCGASSVLVTPEARCEPKPLSDARPMIVSCVDPDEESRIQEAHTRQAHQAQREWWNSGPGQQQTSNSTAMVLARNGNSNVPATLDDIEQPEHQPGMALLLSLILCGTGQIYNGEVSKGIMMMVLCFLLWFVLLGWVVHIWSIVDAVVVAERINRKQHA